MDPINLRNIAGWSALVQTVAGILSFTALMLFFVKGGLWGPLNDALSVIWALSLVPLAGWFFLCNRPVSPVMSAAAALFGIGAMVVFAVLQSLLVVDLLPYEETVGAILTMTGVIGLWLIFNGLMARASEKIPPGLPLMMLAAGAGLLLAAVGYFFGGEQHALAAAGYVTGFIAGFVWSFWLARVLLGGSSMIFQ